MVQINKKKKIKMTLEIDTPYFTSLKTTQQFFITRNLKVHFRCSSYVNHPVYIACFVRASVILHAVA